MILIDSVYGKDENYYPKMILEKKSFCFFMILMILIKIKCINLYQLTGNVRNSCF